MNRAEKEFKNKVVLITQARLGSTRFKNKILHPISHQDSVLSIHLERIARCKSIEYFYIATTNEDGIDSISATAKKYDFNIFKYDGDVNDVLSRYFSISSIVKPEFVVRVTSDCPLIDAELIDKIVNFAIEEDLDYCSNTLVDEYPDGQDIEVFKVGMLEKAYFSAILNSDREHVTPFLKRNSKNLKQFSEINVSDFKEVRMTVDYPEDIFVIEECIRYNGKFATWDVYAAFIKKNSLRFSNQAFIRNSGYLKSIENEK
jgi:spore coat polysaccharide biosynthesis protein SpsF